MKRILGFAMILTLTVVMSAAGKSAKKPDATLKLSGGSVAAGIGFSWGSGTLTYQGKSHKIEVNGLSVGDVGISKTEASGKVYNLKHLADFNGNYAGVGAGATVAGGGSVVTMRNQNGVTIDLVATSKGLKIALAASGVDLKIKE